MARRATAKQAPAIIVSTPAPVARRRSGGGGRSRKRKAPRRRSGSSGASSLKGKITGAAVGGFGVGFLEKTFPNMPALPLVGKKGAIALAVYFLQPKNEILRDVGVAAAAIAGYQFGKEGVISGADDWDDEDSVATQA